MAITIEILAREPAPTPGPTPQPAAAPVGGPGRDQRRQAGSGLSFRAALDSATFKGVVAGVSAPAPVPRPSKLPAAAAEELTLSESSGLLGAARAARGAEGASELNAHRAAAQRYAKAYFSDTRTFARPGESLEVSA